MEKAKKKKKKSLTASKLLDHPFSSPRFPGRDDIVYISSPNALQQHFFVFQNAGASVHICGLRTPILPCAEAEDPRGRPAQAAGRCCGAHGTRLRASSTRPDLANDPGACCAAAAAAAAAAAPFLRKTTEVHPTFAGVMWAILTCWLMQAGRRPWRLPGSLLAGLRASSWC